MIARKSTWQEVRRHGYIQDLNGKTWRVDDLTDDLATLRDRDGKVVTVERQRSYHPVVLVEPTEGDAIKTIQDILEAVAIKEVTTA